MTELVQCNKCGIHTPLSWICYHEDVCNNNVSSVEAAHTLVKCIRQLPGTVINSDLAFAFCNLEIKPTNVEVMYHWTDDHNHFLIEDIGFTIPSHGDELHGACFGPGVYGSPAFEYGRRYAPNSMQCFACRVFKGAGFRRCRKPGISVEEWVVPNTKWVLPCCLVYEEDAPYVTKALFMAIDTAYGTGSPASPQSSVTSNAPMTLCPCNK